MQDIGPVLRDNMQFTHHVADRKEQFLSRALGMDSAVEAFPTSPVGFSLYTIVFSATKFITAKMLWLKCH